MTRTPRIAHLEQSTRTRLWLAVCDVCRLVLTSPASSRDVALADQKRHNTEHHATPAVTS